MLNIFQLFSSDSMIRPKIAFFHIRGGTKNAISGRIMESVENNWKMSSIAENGTPPHLSDKSIKNNGPKRLSKMQKIANFDSFFNVFPNISPNPVEIFAPIFLKYHA